MQSPLRGGTDVRTRPGTIQDAASALAPLALAIAVVLVAMFALGCGGGAAPSSTTATTAGVTTTEEPTTTTEADVPTTEQVDANTIRIGAPLPLSGVYAGDGQDMQTGLQMAVDEINDAGGLLGRPVELRVYDIEDLSSDSLDAAKAYLLDQMKCDVIIEGYGGYGPDYEAFGAGSDVPFLHASGSSAAAALVKSDPGKYGNMFQVSPVEADYGTRAFQAAVQFEDTYVYPNKKVAIFYGDQDWDQKYAAAAAAAAEKAGWQVVLNEQVSYDTTDWSPLLAKIQTEQPAAILTSFLSVDGMASFVEKFMEKPTPSLLDISYLVTLPEMQDALGDKLKGLTGYVSAYVPPSTEGDAWKQRYKDAYGEDVPLTSPPSAYDSVMLWAVAAKAVGDSTKYADIAEYIKNNPYKGLLGTYDFNNPEQMVKAGPAFPIAYAQYKGDGKLAFSGVDAFALPGYIQPAWLKIGETTTTAGQ